MLQTIRDYFSGVFSWIIILMIAVPFALWGINQYTDKGGKASDVAVVNGQGISQPDFLRASEQQQERLRQMLGQSYNPDTFNTPQYKHEVLDQLIERTLLEQAAVNDGLDISDAELTAYITSQPDLQRDGKYAPELYQTFLRNQGLTAAGFEKRLRDSLRVTQLRDAVTNSTVLTPTALDAMIKLREQRRDVAYMILPQAAYAKNIAVDEAKISAYYQSHRAQYMNPERVQVEYIDYSIEGLMASVPVNEQILRHAYDEQAATATNDEQRRASHILIQVPAGADAKTQAAARARIDKIQQQLKGGAAFETLAREYSDDKPSAAKGGDLGYFGKGVMDKAFEEAAFKLKKGEVSAPVRSSFGWHLIKLTDIKTTPRKTFAEARADIERSYRRSQAEKIYYDHTDGLADTVYQQPDSLEPAAKLLGMPIQKSAWLTRAGGPGIGAYPKVIDAAFSEDVLTHSNNSEPLEVAPGHLVVLRIKAHEATSEKPLAEVHDQIAASLRSEMAEAKAAAAAKAMVERLNKGEALAVVAKSANLSVKEVPGLKRKDAGQPPEIVATAFRIARPKSALPGVASTALADGDEAVVVVKAVQDGDPAKLSQEDRVAYQRELQRGYSTAELQEMIAALRAQARIKIWDDRLN